MHSQTTNLSSINLNKLTWMYKFVWSHHLRAQSRLERLCVLHIVCTHTYIHTYIRTCIHTHTYTHSYVHTCIYMYIYTCWQERSLHSGMPEWINLPTYTWDVVKLLLQEPVCAYVYCVCVCVYLHACMRTLRAVQHTMHEHIHMHAHLHAHVHIHAHARIRTYARIHTHLHIKGSMHTHIHTH